MEKKIYYIVGEARTGKSSLCRSITGVSKFAIKRLSILDDNVFNFFIHVRSLQEKEISVQSAIDLLEKNDCEFNIITLRFKELKINNIIYPSAETYIKDFEAKGWNTFGIVVLGNHELPLSFNTNATITTTYNFPKQKPINKLASLVRKSWNLY